MITDNLKNIYHTQEQTLIDTFFLHFLQYITCRADGFEGIANDGVSYPYVDGL